MGSASVEEEFPVPERTPIRTAVPFRRILAHAVHRATYFRAGLAVAHVLRDSAMTGPVNGRVWGTDGNRALPVVDPTHSADSGRGGPVD
jgi:hypothetical protein